MKIVTVVLAGGHGRRIGGDKPLRRLGSRTLLDRAVGQARQWSDCVAVAARSEAQLASVDAQIIMDEQSVEGPLGGLITALRFGSNEGAEAVLAIPADMPFLPDDLAYRLNGEIGSAAVAMASSGGRLHPVCGLWRVAAIDSIPEYVASGRRSLRGFAELVGCIAIDWRAEPVDPFFNINGPEDLAAAERLLGG